MVDQIARMIATGCFAGYSPVAPGTAGSVVAIAVVLSLAGYPLVYGVVMVGVLLAGLWASHQMIRMTKDKDPGCVVIDEILGMLITLWALPLTPVIIISGFFLFRAFDMFKIYPINRLERMGGCWGIMLDDVMAAIYAHVILRLGLWLAQAI